MLGNLYLVNTLGTMFGGGDRFGIMLPTFVLRLSPKKILMLDTSTLGYEKELSELPLEECTICNGSGQRDDEHVQGECNGCDGKGERKNFDTSYPFDVDNVREFHSFVKNCGGFEIC